MENIVMLFSLMPVLRGFVAMVISGFCFPLCGVMVMRLNLVPLRYMLMHGVMLGGAVALALELPLTPVTVAVNLILVLLMTFFTKESRFGFNGSSAAMMVLSMALSSIVMHLADVPAKDTLSLMWGSPFALSRTDVMVLGVMALGLVVYIAVNFRNILALFFSREVALSLGVKVRLHNTVMVLIIALTVALAMKLLGAFLIDALLILPVLSASAFGELQKNGKHGGIKALFVMSSVMGFVFSITGYVLAVVFNLPPAATISLVAGLIFAFITLWRKIK